MGQFNEDVFFAIHSLFFEEEEEEETQFLQADVFQIVQAISEAWASQRVSSPPHPPLVLSLK